MGSCSGCRELVGLGGVNRKHSRINTFMYFVKNTLKRREGKLWKRPGVRTGDE